MPVPTWSVGQVLTASDVNNWLAPTAAFKVATTTITSNTTLTNDTDLVLPLAASSYYAIEAVLSYQCAGASTFFKWTFTLPAGSDTGIYGVYYWTTGSVLTAEIRNWADIPVGGTPSLGVGFPAMIKGIVHTGGSSGNIQLQWAQSNTSASGTSLNAKSHIIAQRIG